MNCIQSINNNKTMRSDASTLALLHFNNPSNPYEDEIGNKWVPSGNIKLGPSNAKFSKSSLQITAGSFLRKEGGFTLGGQDFTIEGWAFVDNASQIWAGIFGFSTRGEKGGINGCCIRLLINNSNKNLEMWTMWEGRYSSTPVKGTLFHFAVVYQHNQSKWTLYVNGKSEATCYRSLGVTYFEHCYLAKDVNAGACNMIGSIDEFRVSSVARYTSNFTPPGAEFQYPKIAKLIYKNPLNINNIWLHSPLIDTHTAMMINFRDSKIKTEVLAENTWSAIDIQYVIEDGHKCAFFNRKGLITSPKNIRTPDNHAMTVDCWIKIKEGNFSITSNNRFDTDQVSACYIGPGNELEISYAGHFAIMKARGGGFIDKVISNPIKANQWFHFAFGVQWSNGRALTYIWVNGKLLGSHLSSRSYGNNYYPNKIGYWDNSGAARSNGPEVAYLTGVRFSNVLRWTSDFTPPSINLY